MPQDPFRTKPHSGKKGLGATRKSAPKSVPSRSPGGATPKGGFKPTGGKGNGGSPLIGQPSVSKTPHIQKRSQLPAGKGGAYVGPKRGRK